MTVTAPPPDAPTNAAPAQPPPARRAARSRRHDDPTSTLRTLHALLASGLAAVPLMGLLEDYGWLVDVWLSMVVVMGPALLLRLRRSPGAADIWPGIVLLVPWLTLRFLPQHAIAGLIPTSGSVHDLSALMDSLHRTTTEGVAPVHSTAAVRLVLCALLGLLAALVDLIAVVGHRGALAGVPLLVVYTVAGAVPRQPVSWLWFIAAAVAFLLLLSVDAGDQLAAWGRRIGRPSGTASGRAGLTVPVSAQRIGVLAVLIAIVLPLVVPDRPRNLIANAFHQSHGSGKGSGDGFGAGGSISPFVKLKGDLTRDRPVPLLTVETSGLRDRPPFYLRANVLPTFTGDGWAADDTGPTAPLGDDNFRTDPATSLLDSREFTARIKVLRSIGNPAIFALPTNVQGVDSTTRWSERDQLLTGSDVRPGQSYQEDVAEATPTREELEAAPASSTPDLRPWLDLPKIPSSVSDLVNRIIDRAGASTPYDKARAIYGYFTDPANHFKYSLRTKKGDSGNDLVDFLKSRTGFCQQYAAAMGVMLRLADVPSRVVLGYMLPKPDGNGVYTVTSFDAHSWVETYFEGIGWVPFDPTPVEGLDGGSQSDLGYAPHPQYSSEAAAPTFGNPRGSAAASSQAKRTSAAVSTASAPVTATATSAPTDRTPLWVLVGVLVVLLVGLTPAAVRMWRRRRRLAAARYGDPDPLWAELSDTATDLGYVWSPARSPRQVAQWLAKDSADPGALTALATAVETRRYAPSQAATVDGDDLTRGLQRVTAGLRAGRSGRTRLRARLWPASLQWGRGVRLRRRH